MASPSTPASSQQSRWRPYLFIILSVVGIGDALYHAYDELTSTFSACYINQILNCGAVFHSGFDTLFGVGFWVYGVVWFPLCVIAGLLVLRRYGELDAYVLVPFLMIGNIFTLYPWYLEIFKIHAYCPVCISLYALNYALTLIAATA